MLSNYGDSDLNYEWLSINVMGTVTVITAG